MANPRTDHMTAGPLDRLFAPRSIAVIGASTREEAIGFRVIRNLRQTGFAGEIFPVNPRYAEIAGLPCLPSVEALPDHVEAAFIAILCAWGSRCRCRRRCRLGSSGRRLC